ncbi:Protein-methionine-sulfoxide reductase catalytic subunit MsrP [bacterium HR17]|uniref:Protein-methionine-sulfoxide reductase catalytic subunit MsrP n=1 Tax=Candidatus Fervidibacter japonicus TaxID=2035412 RepID=A0A2H5X9I3_9BACT|nr:Protein-methionine-sulfoxide reductase catalytic subunit MsrP [bacterium HR17]
MGEREERLPPRQRVVRTFPVMLSNGVPVVDIAQWRLRLFGLVEREVALTFEQVRALPVVRRVCDFHCVTGWSRLGDEWEGVWVREVLALARPKPEARFVMAHSCDGYMTNLDLQVVLDDGMLVWAVNGEPLSPEHGYPLRLLVPSRYGWKSAKWLCGLELMAEDRPGYWEQRGYHMRGDVWAEERYSVPFARRR